MPITTSARVDGLRELGAAMNELKNDIAVRVGAQATSAGAQVIKRRAMNNLSSNQSVDTGLLQKNIITKKLSQSQTQLTAEYIVTVRKRDYPLQGGQKRKRNTRQVGVYVEFGTVKMGARPFIRPAFDNGKSESVQEIKSRLARRIEAVRPK